MAANGDAGGAILLPQLGEYDVSPRALKVAEVIVASGDSDGSASAASDSNSGVHLYTDTQEVFSIANVVAPVFVRDVWGMIVTAFTASVTITVGDTDDANGWLESGQIGATSTGHALILPDSDEVDTAGVYQVARGKFYNDTADSDESIDVQTAGADPAAGRIALYIAYFSVDNAVG